jgi:hypothetical protein
LELKLKLKIEAIPGLSGTNLSLSKIVDKLGLLGRRQLHLVVVQAVPKLRDQCKPFTRCTRRSWTGEWCVTLKNNISESSLASTKTSVALRIEKRCLQQVRFEVLPLPS